MRSLPQALLSSAFVGAGLMLSTVVAHAAAGYEIKPAQEQLVRPGMTKAEVTQAIGRAERVAHYRSEPGASWTYEVARGPGADVTLFDVDFNADGTVAKTGERLVEAD